MMAHKFRRTIIIYHSAWILLHNYSILANALRLLIVTTEFVTAYHYKCLTQR